MSRTPSNMLPLGTLAPDFVDIYDTTTGTDVSLSEIKSNTATVVMFICNHCPFVIHLHEGLTEFIQDYLPKGVSIIAVSSNDVENYPQDNPEKMKTLFSALNWNIPYLYDESQEVAKAYHAACTPDFYVFDSEMKCVYRGQFDDSRPQSNIPVTGKDLRLALNQVLDGKAVFDEQKPSLGCNIKWKS